MKKTLKFVRHFSYGILFSGIALLPRIANSQTGENDSKFNTFDNISAAGTNGMVNSSVMQADNKTILVGNFSLYNNHTTKGIVRLNTDGTIDTDFNSGSGVNGSIASLALQFDDKIIIGGNFTSYNGVAVNRVARLHKNGTIDMTFLPNVGANGKILSVVLQQNGKILVGGEFTIYDNKPVNKLVRLNKDGTLDNTFYFPDTVNYVSRIVLQQDGKIIIGGNYKFYDAYLTRLNKNGSKDYSFSNPDFFNKSTQIAEIETVIMQGNKILVGGGISTGIEGRYGLLFRMNANGTVDSTFEYEKNSYVWIKSLALQQDGKIIIAGRSNIYSDDNVSYNYIGRLNPSGSADSTFTIHNNQRNYAIACNTISIQTDGKIIAGGYFSTIGGLLIDNVVRLTSNGDFDPTFNQKTGANGSIFSTAKQSNGRILIGGNFLTYNYKVANRIARLKKDGSLDPSFDSGTGPNGVVNAIAIQSNGKIIIGGAFTSYNDEPCQHIAQLNTNGTLDKSFQASGVDGVINTIVIQENEKIVICGQFSSVNGIASKNIARLRSNGKIDLNFSSSLSDHTLDVVNVCIIDKNGKILIGGAYRDIYPFNSPYHSLVRLNPNGSLDSSFIWKSHESSLAFVYALALQPDNKILVGGGRIQNGIHIIDPFEGYIRRLNVDGTDDSLFNSMQNTSFFYGMNNPVRTITILQNDKIFFGGQFNYPFVNHTCLLNADGSIDSSFTANANSSLYTSMLVNRNKMIIAGDFTLYNSTVRTGIASVSVACEASAYRSVIGETPTSLTNVTSLTLFPNPASSTLTLDNVVLGSKLTIRDALGRVMDTKTVNTVKENIELGNYSNGIYFLTTENNGVTANLKFIVSK